MFECFGGVLLFFFKKKFLFFFVESWIFDGNLSGAVTVEGFS